ncbi:MAG TPA: hypothetical protein VGF63_11720 [Solirubrobacteraceae bacterium]|jgi:hypothetical protein
MPSSLRLIRVPALAVLAVLALTALAAGPASASSATKTCSFGSVQYIGNAFQLNELRVTSLTCATARTTVHAYWSCFTHAGKSPDGHCKTKVNRFSCKEGKRNYGEPLNGKPTNFAVRVTCTRAKQRAVFAFTETLR